MSLAAASVTVELALRRCCADGCVDSSGGDGVGLLTAVVVLIITAVASVVVVVLVVLVVVVVLVVGLIPRAVHKQKPRFSSVVVLLRTRGIPAYLFLQTGIACPVGGAMVIVKSPALSRTRGNGLMLIESMLVLVVSLLSSSLVGLWLLLLWS